MESKPFTSTLRVRHKLRRWMLDIYEDFYFQSTSHPYTEGFWSDNPNISLIRLIIDIFTTKLHIPLVTLCQSNLSVEQSLHFIDESHETYRNLIILHLYFIESTLRTFFIHSLVEMMSSCLYIRVFELFLLCSTGSCCDWMLCWWL